MTSYRESIMNSGKIFYNQAVSGAEYIVAQLPTVPATSISMGYIFTVLPSLGGATPFAALGVAGALTLIGHKCANRFAIFMRIHSQFVENNIAPKLNYYKMPYHFGSSPLDNLNAEDKKNALLGKGDIKWKYAKKTGCVKPIREFIKWSVCTLATMTTGAVITTGLGAAAGAVIAAATSTAFAPAIISTAALTALVFASVKALQYGLLALKEAIKVVVNGVVLVFTCLKAVFAYLYNAIKRCSASFENKRRDNDYLNKFNDLKLKFAALANKVKKSKDFSKESFKDFSKESFADLEVIKNEKDKITYVFLRNDTAKVNLLNLISFTNDMVKGYKVYMKQLNEYINAIKTMKDDRNKLIINSNKNPKTLKRITDELTQIHKVIHILNHVKPKEKNPLGQETFY